MDRLFKLSYYVRFVILACVALALAACNRSLPIPPLAGSATASPTLSQDPTPSPTHRPQDDALHPSQDDAPPTRAAQAPISPLPTPIPPPAVDMGDLSLFRSALKPDFVADVEALPGAPRYFIQATLDPDEPTRLAGVQQVRYTNQEDTPLDDLYFRLYPNLPGYGGSMTVEKVVLNGAPVETRLEAQNSALRVPLDPPLAPGDVVDLTLWFRETLPTDTSAGYGLYAYADDVYALAGFYPTIPVYDDEGWNVEVAPPYGDATFTDVALYQVQLTVPEDLTVVTSGSTLETSDNDDGTRTWIAVGGPLLRRAGRDPVA